MIFKILILSLFGKKYLPTAVVGKVSHLYSIVGVYGRTVF